MSDHLPTDARREVAERDSRRWWAAMMLSLDIDTMDAILASRPVLVSSLDPRVLRFGLRGRKLSGHDYLFVDERILDAIAEAGADAVSPIVAKRQALP